MTSLVRPPNLAAKLISQLRTNLRSYEDCIRAIPLDFARSYVERNQESFVRKDEFVETLFEPHQVHHITAITGDDKIVLTNSIAYAVAPMAAAERLLGIRISQPDVGVSEDVGNFAEEWILRPTNRVSGWSGTRSGAGSHGVPWTLDAVKLRGISAVRKQSEEDMDMASKFKGVSVSAAWTNKSWISYTDHQLALVLGLTLFDFRDERDFPFMYSSEGGCGGAPPYGVVETTRNTLWHFNRGKSKIPLLGIMKEAAMASAGLVTNQNLLLLRCVHLASHDPKRWVEFTARIKEAKNSGETESTIAKAIALLTDDDPIPPELDEKSIEIEPTNTYVGGLISKLRAENYLMTELDVRVHKLAQDRVKAIKGSIPYNTIAYESKAALKAARKQNYSALTHLWEVKDEDRQQANYHLDTVPDYRSHDALDLISEYYKINEGARHGSLSYQPYIKLFRRSDVLEYFDSGARKLLADSITQRNSFEYDYARDKAFANASEVERDKIITTWLNTDGTWIDEDSLLKTAPISIGVTDPLLYAKAASLVAQAEEEGRSFMLLLVTADSALIGSIRALSTQIFAASPRVYYTWLRNQEPGLPASVYRMNPLSKIPIPSVLPGQTAYLPKRVQSWANAHYGDGYKPGERIDFYILIDEPNFFRTLDNRAFEGPSDRITTAGWFVPHDFDTVGRVPFFSKDIKSVMQKTAFNKQRLGGGSHPNF